MRLQRRLIALFLACAGILAVLELLDFEHSAPLLWYLAHHLFALVAGASISGVVFEKIARQSVLADFKREFLDSSDMSKLFADEQRQKWVGQILKAQLPADPALSEAIYSDVVQPFMTEKRIRRRLDYRIEFLPEERGNWILEPLRNASSDYARIATEADFQQSLPASLSRVNVSLVIGSSYESLDEAFDDDACICRDHLTFGADDAAAVREALKSSAADPEGCIADFAVQLSVAGTRVPISSSEFDSKSSRLRFWFDLSGRVSGDLHLHVRISAPYDRSSGNYAVVFGEPTSRASIRFRPGAETDIASVAVMHFMQGGHRPTVTRNARAKEIELTFPDSLGNERWVLPRSGLVFVWNGAAPGKPSSSASISTGGTAAIKSTARAS